MIHKVIVYIMSHLLVSNMFNVIVCCGRWTHYSSVTWRAYLQLEGSIVVCGRTPKGLMSHEFPLWPGQMVTMILGCRLWLTDRNYREEFIQTTKKKLFVNSNTNAANNLY